MYSRYRLTRGNMKRFTILCIFQLFVFVSCLPVASRPLPQLLLDTEHESLVPKPAAVAPAPSVGRHTPTSQTRRARTPHKRKLKIKNASRHGQGELGGSRSGRRGKAGRARNDTCMVCLPSGRRGGGRSGEISWISSVRYTNVRRQVEQQRPSSRRATPI